MNIASIACSLPERVVTNDELLAAIAEQSAPHLDGQLEPVLRQFRALFRLSGTRERRRRAAGERAFDFAKRAAEQALERAALRAADIDLMLYVGVGRGWIEPGMATYFLHKLGMTRATGFDVLDACLSWLRALHIAYHFIRNGVYRNVMILNAEFNTPEYMQMAIKHPEEVAYRFAQLTIGEAATATILASGETAVEPHFEFKTDPSRHDLCKIPLPNIASYSDSERCPNTDPLVFFAYSAELFAAAQEMIPAIYASSPELRRRRYDIAFSHSASKTIMDGLADRLGAGDKLVNLYPIYGNTVSASIPTAMAWAVDHGRLRRDMQMMLCMGSAGFSAGMCHIAY